MSPTLRMALAVWGLLIVAYLLWRMSRPAYQKSCLESWDGEHRFVHETAERVRYLRCSECGCTTPGIIESHPARSFSLPAAKGFDRSRAMRFPEDTRNVRMH